MRLLLAFSLVVVITSPVSAICEVVFSAKNATAYWSNSECLQVMTPEMFRSISGSELIGITSEMISLIRSDHIRMLSIKTCSALPIDFVALLRRQCNGFRSECVSHLPVEVFKVMSLQCISSLSVEGIRSMTGQQISYISDRNIRGLNTVQNSVLSAEQCYTLTQGQVQNLRSCSRLQKSCFSLLKLNSLTNSCWIDIPPETIRGMGVKRFSLVNDDCFPSSTKPEQVAVLTSECSAITGEEAEALSPPQCSSLTPICASLLGLQSVQLTPECVLSMSPEVFGALSPTSLSLLPCDAFCRVNGDMLAALTPTACSKLGKNQVMKLTHPACLSMSRECLQQLWEPARALLVEGCDVKYDSPGSVIRRRSPAPKMPSPCDHQNWDQIRENNKAAADKSTELNKKKNTGIHKLHTIQEKEPSASYAIFWYLPLAAAVFCLVYRRRHWHYNELP